MSASATQGGHDNMFKTGLRISLNSSRLPCEFVANPFSGSRDIRRKPRFCPWWPWPLTFDLDLQTHPSVASFIYPHNMVNVGPLTAEICWRVGCTPANFNGFRVFVSLLHRRRSMEVNRTLHDVWPSPGLVHCILIWEALAP